MFTVLMYGGIGDTLRNLSIFPHQWLHEKFGVKTTAFYKHWRLTGEHQYANPPGTEFFHALADRFPSLRWGGETTSHHGPGAIANRAAREMIKLGNRGETYFFRVEPTLTPGEKAALPDFGNGEVIGIQTHLLGTKTKAWGLDNWRRYIEMLSQAHPEATIVIIETSAEVDRLALGPNIVTTRHLNLFQMLHLFRHFTLMVSIDSWTKYAAAWNNIPQIVVVPDQSSQYPILTAEEELGRQLAGIYGVPRNRIIGLEKDARGRGRLTLDLISKLSPEQLFAESEEHRRRFPPPPNR